MNPRTATKPRPHAGADVPQTSRLATRDAGPSSFCCVCDFPPKGAVANGGYVDEVVAYTQTVAGVTKRYYPHYNHLYSVAALTDSTGAVVERFQYDAYGKQKITDASGNVTRAKSSVGWDRGFTGYMTDSESGLAYARGRMYSPGLGRFVSRDPQRQEVRYDGDLRYWIGPQPEDGYIDGFSLYSGYFVPNDVDPTGWYIPPRTPGDDRPRPPQPPRPPPFIDAGENFYYDTSGFNCLGYATGCKHSLQVKPKKSLSSVMSELGYKCTVGISAKDCPAHCKCSDYVMVYVYVRKEWKENPPKPFGDPWNDPWGNYPPEIFDFHGLKGGPDGYTYQPSHQDKLDLRKWKPTDAAPDYFTAAWQLVTKACCCKPDSMP